MPARSRSIMQMLVMELLVASMLSSLFGWVYLPPLIAAPLEAVCCTGGLAVHHERAGKMLRIAGLVVAGPVTRACAASRENVCQFAAVPIDLEAGGLVVARGVGDHPDDVQRLAPGNEASLYGAPSATAHSYLATLAVARASDPLPPDGTRPRAWLDAMGF